MGLSLVSSLRRIHRNAVLILIGAALLSACERREDPQSVPPDLANHAYPSDFSASGLITLKAGQYSEPAAPNSASLVAVELITSAAGDLSGDGRDDAAAILVTNAGGSGSFYELAVVIAHGQGEDEVGAVLLGDRTPVEHLSIQDETVIVDLRTRGPDDSMAVTTRTERQFYIWQNGQLVRSELAPAD
jgi:hypothetical protein